MSGQKTRKLDTLAKLFQAIRSRTICWQGIGQLAKVRTICSSAVAATYDAPSITSLVARKLLGASFGLVRRQAASSMVEMRGTAW